MNEIRLIDANALKTAMMKAFNCENATKYGNKNAEQQANSYSTLMLYEVSDIVEDCIDNAPTVHGIVGFVERPKGKWLPQDNYNREYKCSVCGRIVEKDRFIKAEVQYPFCHCGADMRGEKNDTQD